MSRYQYVGRRAAGYRAQVFVIDVAGDGVELDPRYDLRNHSPTGFEWGYSGSGPAQLALALLAHCLGDDDAALRFYQKFKFRYVAAFGHDAWSMTDAEIRVAVQRIREERELL